MRAIFHFTIHYYLEVICKSTVFIQCKNENLENVKEFLSLYSSWITQI